MPRDHRRRLLLKTDIVGYGTRDDRDQHVIQRNFLHLLEDAAAAAGLNRRKWFTQSSGDGEFAVLPGNEPEPRVVDEFVRQLDKALGRHNAGVLPSARMRLRVAIHFGVVSSADNGISGAAAVTVGRLLDCAPLREAITSEESANLALIVSDEIYRGTIAGHHTTWDDGAFRRVTVQVKELTAHAWILVPGAGAPRGDVRERNPREESARERTGREQTPRPSQGPRASQVVVNTFYGTVNTHGGDIGISNH
ncbi:hypothetical protein ACFOWE_03655 [Planomonospora corallina]|uniref:Guanylate cyclase domain-containing protein n=1 Tax=Planomonospora corallina TaxID=1806052 RepID=A0ABV8I2V2_9ACTN